MEVQQLEAILHAARAQLLQPAQHLGHRQAELRPIAAGSLPASAAPGRELHPHTNLRPDPDPLGVLQDQAELGVLLDHGDDVAADLLGQHRHLDELGVFEAVADDWRVVVGLRGDREQFRLGPRLEPEAVLAAEVEHFFDDLPLLVDLDRVDADVAAVVLVLGDCGTKCVMNVADAVPQDVAEPDQHRKADAAKHQVIRELLQIDRARRVFRRVNQDVA